MIQVCDFLADILAEFMRTDRSWGPSLPVPECQWVRGLGRRDLLQAMIIGFKQVQCSLRLGVGTGYLLVVAGMGRAT